MIKKSLGAAVSKSQSITPSPAVGNLNTHRQFSCFPVPVSSIWTTRIRYVLVILGRDIQTHFMASSSLLHTTLQPSDTHWYLCFTLYVTEN